MITLEKLRKLRELLKRRGLKLVTCESMTGGLLGATITSLPGASEFYLGGIITYSYSLKEWIGVPQELLRIEGAVSHVTAEQMALSLIRLWEGDLLALSVTGNAGPSPSEGKPVGLFYLGWAINHRGQLRSGAEEHKVSGSRGEVREKAVLKAIRLALRLLSEL